MSRTSIKVVLLIAIFTVIVKSDSGPYLGNLGAQIEAEVRRSLAPLQNLGPSIQANVQNNLAHLNDLQANIQKSVYDSLAPVRELQALVAVKTGQNGYTIATYRPSGRTFIIRDGTKYECSGSISSNGECSTESTRFVPKKDEDYCFSDHIIRVNNYLCFASGSGVSVSSYNGNVECRSKDGNTLLVTAETYRSMCKNIVASVDYQYYPTSNTLPIQSNTIKCQTGPPLMCSYTENNVLNTLLGSNIVVY